MRDFLEYIGKILLGILAILILLAAIKSCVDEEQQIHDCYIQEPKTKECEYILWKEENKNQDDDFVTGMLLGQAMSGGLR